MVHTNKILTVSYGTFSCTLEGFEDSFDTMKSIAEYFRDLASDDRYFGAEPPQPDADMLARIAQRDVSRRVEAHSTDNGTIVLRAAESDTVPDTATLAATTTAAVATVAIEEPVVEIVSAPDTPPEVAEDAVETVVETTGTSDITEPLGEEIELVEEVETPDTAPETVEADVLACIDEPSDDEAEITDGGSDYDFDDANDEIIEENIDEEIIDEALVEQAMPEVDEVVEQQQEQPETDAAPEAEVEEVDDVDDAPEIAADVPTEDTTEIAVDDVEMDQAQVVAQVVAPASQTVTSVDSIAAKLQRIRAVVSQNDSMVQMDDYTEDQHADGFVTDAAQDISEALEIDDEVLATPEADDSDDQVSRILDQIDADAELDAPQSDAAPEVESEEDFFATKHQPEVEPVDEDVDDVFGDTTMTEPVADSVPEPLQARIVKVKRTDLEAAIASGQLEQMEDGDDTDGADIFEDQDPDLAQESSLSAEDEADLMRELAAVEEEMAIEEDVIGEVADDVSDNAPDDATDDALDFDSANSEAEFPEAEENIFGDDILSDEPAHAALLQAVSEDEADLSRLMNAADEKLDDPETSSRHETYSQLRAAVAVAEAERSAGGAIDADEDKEYRHDLAQVVRPRRPSADGARVASRPAVDSRPAPLKLVAEQRVDAGAGNANRGPVRPRRVMGDAGTPDSTGADSAFAEFANRMGATELPDLLEAAAAYLSFVEGHERFSRPQLMNKVRLVKQDGYNREDGLRSFGQLLRDGKIEKKGGGRFAASADIGFRPDEREAEAG